MQLWTYIQGQSDTKIVISLFLVAKVIYSYSNKDKFNGFLKEEGTAIENATRLGHKKSDYVAYMVVFRHTLCGGEIH